jgi:apolipoprotein N-acyltransferase
MTRPDLPSLALALAAGAASVFAFAPFEATLLPVVTLALLFLAWQAAASARAAAWLGFAFGAGLFGAGVSWVYVALNTFGGMPLPLAAIGTAGFCAYLALYPALAGWLAARWTAPGSWRRLAAAAAAWTLTEWARGWVLTGFPWLSLGHSQLPATGATALGAYAPIGGVFLVTLALAGCAALLASAIGAIAAPARPARIAALAGAAALVAGVGAGLGRVEWTHPAGDPVAVSLVQGNVPQSLKFDAGFRRQTFDLYTGLVAASRGRLVVLPESAFPMLSGDVPDDVLRALLRTGMARDGDVIVGLFTAEPPAAGEREFRVYNSVVTLGAGSPQVYRKRHLVPFGETIPLEPVLGWFINGILSIPLSSQTPGAADQPPLAVAGQRVAVNICYEDAFGADIRPQAAAATMLVNVTNDAWYGRSLAAMQHNQIAAMRALETGRPLLRATNTGVTSAIDHRGREIARLPWFTRGILEVEAAGRQGVTPYVRWGDGPAAALALVLLAAAAVGARRAAQGGPAR